MSGYWIRTKSGEKGPFSEDKICDLVDAGKVPLSLKVFDADGNAVVVEDIYYEPEESEVVEEPEATDDLSDMDEAFAECDEVGAASDDHGYDDDGYDDDGYDDDGYDDDYEEPAPPPRRTSRAAAPRRGAPQSRAPQRGAPKRGGPARTSAKRAAAQRSDRRDRSNQRDRSDRRNRGAADASERPQFDPSKRSPIPAIIILIVLLGGAGAALWFARPEALFGPPYHGKWVTTPEEMFGMNVSQAGLDELPDEMAEELAAKLQTEISITISDMQLTANLGGEMQETVEYVAKSLGNQRYQLMNAENNELLLDFRCARNQLILKDGGKEIVLRRQ